MRKTMTQSPAKAASETGDPLLLTPGPLTTSKSVKEAMLHDWGSRDTAFIRMNSEVRDLLLEIAGADPQTYAAIPLQGSGTFAIEAMLTTLVPKHGHVLLVVNGAYGLRAKEICRIAGRNFRSTRPQRMCRHRLARSKPFSSANPQLPTFSLSIVKPPPVYSIRSRR